MTTGLQARYKTETCKRPRLLHAGGKESSNICRLTALRRQRSRVLQQQQQNSSFMCVIKGTLRLHPVPNTPQECVLWPYWPPVKGAGPQIPAGDGRLVKVLCQTSLQNGWNKQTEEIFQHGRKTFAEVLSAPWFKDDRLQQQHKQWRKINLSHINQHPKELIGRNRDAKWKLSKSRNWSQESLMLCKHLMHS